MRRSLSCLLVALLLAMPRVAQSAPAWKIEPAVLTGLDGAARSLAKAARTDELKVVIDVLRELGMRDDKRTKLQQSCEADAEKARAKPNASAVADAGKRLKAAAKQLAASLAAQPEETRVALAGVVLRLDDSLAAAHELVGNEKIGEEWLTPDELVCRGRRSEIQGALRDVRKLAIDIPVAPSEHPLLLEINGAPGTQLKWKTLTIHTTWSPEKATRVLREALRATALSSWLRGGKLAPHGPGYPQTWVWLGTREHYLKSIDIELANGKLSAAEAERVRKLGSYYDSERLIVEGGVTESEIAATVMLYTSPLESGVQSSLFVGHSNWVTMALWGAAIPSFTWTETKETRVGAAGHTRLESDAERIEREQFVRLSNAGLVGCRAYLAYLAGRGEDPPWRTTMLDQIGLITGVELLKATSVIEFVQELSLLPALVLATTTAAEADPEPAYAKGVGQPLGPFEARWRAWIRGREPGLVQQLGGAAVSVDPQIVAALEHLNELRAQAFARIRPTPQPVILDLSLSQGAHAHARYLNRNREQAQAWPDAHEEYTDRPGFTTEGAWAGAHSVIAPGVATPSEAIDRWMGTFYHRLPLLEPGVLRIGCGVEKGMVVLDADSLRAPWIYDAVIVWPYDGMSDVPTRFVPELPNPVPGADQSRFGFPITLQAPRLDPEFEGCDIELALFQGETPVECHVSTPSKPTNIELAPRGAWCLIPKSPLIDGRRYTVRARWIGATRSLSWSFDT